MIRLENLPDLLSEDEKLDLYRNWNDESYKVLAERNIRLAIKVAKSFRNTGIEEDDLLAIAMEGLVRAAKTFRPDMEFEFSTYAVSVIKNTICLEIRRNKKSIKPDYSLDEPIVTPNGICELGALLPDKFSMDSRIKMSEILSAIETGLQNKSTRDQYVIRKWLEGVPQRKIAAELGVSRQLVSQKIIKFRNRYIGDLVE